MKVALVHDWLTGMRGGERCLEAFLQIYPQADIFTLLHIPGTTSAAIDARVKSVSFLGRLPRVKHYYRALLPLFPFAAKQFDLRGYDLVISLSHAAAKNVVVAPGTRHLVYCFTPMRYIWDQAASYLGMLTPIFWPMILWLRRWDFKGSAAPDRFIAISRFVAARIRKFYRRRADVVYPPVNTNWIKPISIFTPGEAFLCAGALVPYKKVELAIRACNQLQQKLWIVGGGPEEPKLRRIAGPTVEFLGRLSDEELADRYRRCRALIFPGCEDFGMVPIECLAAGRPIIGLHAGALRETLRCVRPWQSQLAVADASGVFIQHTAGDPVQALVAGMGYFIAHENQFSPQACVRQAARFSPEAFFQAWAGLESENHSALAAGA